MGATATRPQAGSERSPTAERDGVVRHLGADDRSSTRVRIVDGALRCLARQGIAKTTVDDIARAAGLSRATVYRTFPEGKEGILAAVVETEVARLFSSLAVVMGEATDLEDVLVAGMVESARRLRSHEALTYLLEHEPGRRPALPHLRRARPGPPGGRRPGGTLLRPLARARAGVAGGRVGRAHRPGLLLRPVARTPT